MDDLRVDYDQLAQTYEDRYTGDIVNWMAGAGFEPIEYRVPPRAVQNRDREGAPAWCNMMDRGQTRNE